MRCMLTTVLLLVAAAAPAQEWRSLGTARTTGRIVDLAVHPKDHSTFYVAAATGGLWKTVNKGVTFTCVFSKGAVSIGDIALSPADPQTVWVGTGEANNQRSSYAGTGIWLSRDGGKSWRNTGLADGHHVGRIVCHPTDPKVAYAAVLGHLYTTNRERGLYRTVDGGRSWRCVKHLGSKVGFVDVAIDPLRPKTLYAASYQRLRRAWHYAGYGEGSRLWKSVDGGDTWRPMTRGLPKGRLGRIGLSVHAADPRIVYACIEHEPSAEEAARRRPRALCQVYKSTDRGEHWKLVNRKPASVSYSYYYGQIRVDPSDPQRVWVLSVPLWHSADGGVTWKNDGARGCHVDHHALWIDPTDGEHLILGGDGGLYMSWDRGRTWDSINTLPIVQVYALTADNRQPYTVYYGTQDDGTWGVPSATGDRRGITGRHNFKVGGGDGFYCQADPEDPDVLFMESQFGGLRRVDIRTGAGRYIKPRRARGYPRLRWNWMSPLLLSPHNPRIIYYGSQCLHMSLDRGDHWRTISPDLTTNDPDKLKGNVPHCTITTLDESPLKPGLLWVGTDDGRLQVTVDGGRGWREVGRNLPADVHRLWVSRVIASRHAEATAFVSYTGYREDDFRPLLYMTRDYGTTWLPIHNNLPPGSINVVRQHPEVADLLVVGTETGVFWSGDCGGTWSPLGRGLPSVAVHDLFLHTRDGDLVAGTHGRGCWVLDLLPLVESRRRRPTGVAALLGVKCPPARVAEPRRLVYGARHHTAPNPPAGARIHYWLAAKQAEGVRIQVLDPAGTLVYEGRAVGEKGFNTFVWNLRRTSLRQAASAMGNRFSRAGRDVARRIRERMAGRRPGASARRPRARAARSGGGRGATVPPGDYRVRLVIGKRTWSGSFKVKPPVGNTIKRLGL